MSRRQADGAHLRNRPSVLIADDDPIVRSLLSAQLRENYKLLPPASDAAEAIATAAAHQPDIAIVDLQMPEGGGLRATRDIRRVAPGATVVILSADEEDHVVRETLRAGAVTYLRKSISSGALKHTLETAVAADRRIDRRADEPSAASATPPAGEGRTAAAPSAPVRIRT